MEVQPTDHEDAAFAVFMVLLTRVVVEWELNLYIPMSKVKLIQLSSSFRWKKT